jgi:SAM-dependent methyltransferase
MIKRWQSPTQQKQPHHLRGERPIERPTDGLDFGDLWRITPVSRQFGYDRGLPIDRYYIERFLGRHSADIQGRVLEIGDDSYTRQFGGERVTVRDVLYVTPGNPVATIVGDLAHADHIPSDTFDCFILTQTLQFIYDVPAALRTVHRILKPGGVVLATFPGVSQVSQDQWAKDWYWSFTRLSARRAFEENFAGSHVAVAALGNRLAATAFLQGLAVVELTEAELAYHDPHVEFLIAVRAVKSEVER